MTSEFDDEDRILIERLVAAMDPTHPDADLLQLLVAIGRSHRPYLELLEGLVESLCRRLALGEDCQISREESIRRTDEILQTLSPNREAFRKQIVFLEMIQARRPSNILPQ